MNIKQLSIVEKHKSPSQKQDSTSSADKATQHAFQQQLPQQKYQTSSRNSHKYSQKKKPWNYHHLEKSTIESNYSIQRQTTTPRSTPSQIDSCHSTEALSRSGKKLD